MKFRALPKTTRDWEQTVVRTAIVAGFMLLITQLWARLALSGLMRQDIKEILCPFSLLLSFFLVCCSVTALLQRHRVLSLATAVIGIISALIALLPILLHEAIRN